LFELNLGQPLFQWQEQKIKKVLRDRVFDVGAGRRSVWETEAREKLRIAWQPGLDDFGARDAKFFQCGAKAAVVEESDLDGIVNGQFPGNQLADARVRPIYFR